MADKNNIIRDYVKEAGITQKELAKRWTEWRGWKVHEAQISEWVTGNGSMSRATSEEFRRFVAENPA